MTLNRTLMAAVAGVLVLASAGSAAAQSNLRVVMHSDLKIVDPIWTTAYISRNYGYMVYDTLFALDEQLQIQPMVGPTRSATTISPTPSRCAKGSMARRRAGRRRGRDRLDRALGREGQHGPAAHVVRRKHEGDRRARFQMQLKEPYGLVLLSLAKPSSNVPFIMPKRIAETPSSEQISEYVGSGPFVFERDEWEPGNKAVFTKFEGLQAAQRAAELGRRRQRSPRSTGSSGSGSRTCRPRSTR